MDIRGFEDELILEEKERKKPSTICARNIYIAGRFTEENCKWVGKPNYSYISSKYHLNTWITINKGVIVTKMNKEVDMVCWLLPFKKTKIIEKAETLGIPVIKYSSFVDIVEE